VNNPRAQEPASSRGLDWAVRGLIVLAVAWIYRPALGGAWLWDDGLEVARNPVIRDPAGWWRCWLGSGSMDYFPLKTTLQWVEWHLWGDRVAGYHACNAALHAACALLLWRVLAKLGVRLAWLGGLLFAIHPLAVESVAWISEFKNPLSLFLLFWAFLLFLDWDARDCALRNPARRDVGGDEGGDVAHPPREYLASLLLFLAALLSKTSVVIFPAFLLLHAWWKRGRVGRRDVMAALPFAIASLTLGLVTVWFQAHRATGLAGTPAGFPARLGQAGWQIWIYLGHCLVPMNPEPVYPETPAGALGVLPWLGLGVLIWILWRRRGGFGRHALLGGGWFFLNLVPVLGLVPISYLRVAPGADHLAYISVAGLCGLAAAAMGGIRLRTGTGRTILVVVVASLAATLAWRSHRHAGVFRNEGSLWGYALERNPGSWLAHNNRGKVLMESGRPAEAAVLFADAVRLEPDSPEAHANLGNALQQLGRAADARVEYAKALAIDPGSAGVAYGLGVSLLLSGQPAEAADWFRVSLRGEPGRATAHNDLGLCLMKLGRPEKATAEYREALRIDPDLPEAHLNLGNAWFQADRLSDAAVEYRKALRLNPAYRAAHNNLGYALRRLGLYTEAAAEFDAAQRVQNGH